MATRKRERSRTFCSLRQVGSAGNRQREAATVGMIAPGLRDASGGCDFCGGGKKWFDWV